MGTHLYSHSMEWEATDGSGKLLTDIFSSTGRYKVIFFYPSDWDTSSQALLGEVIKKASQFSSSDCSLFACSSDSLLSHALWIKEELGGSLPFPLLVDTAGALSTRFSMFEGEEKLCLRGFVITDSHGQELETVASALDSQELVKLALSAVMWIPRSSSEQSGKCFPIDDCGKPVQKEENLAKHLRSLILEKSKQESPSEDKRTSSILFNNHMSRAESRMARGFF